MRRAFFFICAAALGFGACTGVFFDKGNAFPCDFNAGLGVRDAVCVEGDVCGTDNLCHPYFYEGPRFEGPAKLPQFAPGEFETIHPRALNRPVTALARSPFGSPVLVRLDDGRTLKLDQKQLGPGLEFSGLADPVAVTLGMNEAVAGIRDGGLAYVANVGGMVQANDEGSAATRLRATKVGPLQLRLQAVSTGGSGEVTLEPAPPPPMNRKLEITTPYTVPGTVTDVGILTRGGRQSVIVHTEQGLWLENADGGFDQQTMHAANSAVFRLNAAGTLLVEQHDRVLTVWQVAVEPSGHSLQLAWPACMPCPPNMRIEASAPVPPSEGVAVEVLCRSMSSKARLLRRVIGSAAVESTDLCNEVELPFPFDPARLSEQNDVLVAAPAQVGFSVGGSRGELWQGETLSSLLPVTLERVPVDVFLVSVNSPAGSSDNLAVFTDRYFAAMIPPHGNREPLGFRRIDSAEDFGSSTSLRFFTSVHGTTGWGLQTNGVLTRVAVNDADDGGARADYGARLITPTGAPIARTAGGESFNGPDGGPLSFIIAADDALYFVPSPTKDLTDDPSGNGDLAPQLQPEPSVPIRSLALERTPLGTDGVGRARGYLVTSRNVFEWTFGVTPARWSSRPLVIAGGEPLEVWFDTNRSALGRVGYSDGRIFTLPGAYQLALPLPGDDAGTTVSVVDYENFGGWPVALTRHGLFIARWDQSPEGKLLNKFPDGGINRPMEWREITQPDGGRPWARGEKTRGKLFTSSRAGLADGGTEFKLFVFLDDGVYQVGAFTR